MMSETVDEALLKVVGEIRELLGQMNTKLSGQAKAERISKAKEENDLISVILEHVPECKISPTGNYEFECPFHDSEEAWRGSDSSLFAYPDRQSWICYADGCGKGGSVIDFVMAIKKLGFGEALGVLEKRAGIA